MKTDILQNYSFYSALDAKSIEFLHKNLKKISVPKGTILFFQGDICDSILFLTQGKVRLYIQSENAEEIALYQLNEGYLLDVASVKELAHRSDAYQGFLRQHMNISLMNWEVHE